MMTFVYLCDLCWGRVNPGVVPIHTPGPWQECFLCSVVTKTVTQIKASVSEEGTVQFA